VRFYLLLALAACASLARIATADEVTADPAVVTCHAAAARDDRGCNGLADAAAVTRCRAGVMAVRQQTHTDGCRKGSRRGRLFICNGARSGQPGRCEKLRLLGMPYHAALCRAVAGRDGAACGDAGGEVAVAACRAQAATMALVSGGRVPMPRGLALDGDLAWLTLPKVTAAACDRWASERTPPR